MGDPLGCLNGIDQVTFDRYRYAEIKHGRVAQLAFIGHLVTALGVRFPGYLSSSAELKFEDVPAGLGALSAVPSLGLLQIFLFCGVLEFSIFKQDEGSFPGDFSASYNVRTICCWSYLSFRRWTRCFLNEVLN